MEEFASEDTIGQVLQFPISVNYRKITSIIDIALTCMARDYKGFGSGHEMSNGVLVWQK